MSNTETAVDKRLEDINIAYIDRKGAVKLVKFEKDWDSRTCEEQLEYAIALASSLNYAAETAYKERDAANAELDKVIALNKNAAEKVRISDQLLTQTINSSNAEKQELMARIQELMQETRELSVHIKELSGVNE
jgi:hypothetical protein